MACGTCGNQGSTVVDAQSALDAMMGFATGGALNMTPIMVENGTVRMEFIGGSWGEQTFVGKVSGRVYRAGRDPVSRFHDVDARDVEHLIGMELFRIVPPELLAQAAQVEDTPMVSAQQVVTAPRGKRR